MTVEVLQIPRSPSGAGAEEPGEEAADLAEAERRDKLLCARCRIGVSEASLLFVATGTGPRAVFVNPQGRVFEIVTVRDAFNIALVSGPTVEATWFPGYAWRIANCGGCGAHLGWRFEGASGGLPPVFFGLVASSVTGADGGAG
jgi:hypothetical protein